MPPFPEDRFVDAVKQVVKANAAWGAPLRLGRHALRASADVRHRRGHRRQARTEYQFRILVTPVGPYYAGGVKPVAVKVPEFDRAAPHGTGNIKAGLNYAMSLYPSVQAHAEGFADNMFLDPQTHTFVEESGGANFLFVDKDGTLVVPKSPQTRSFPRSRAAAWSPLRRPCWA